MDRWNRYVLQYPKGERQIPGYCNEEETVFGTCDCSSDTRNENRHSFGCPFYVSK